MSEQHPLRWWKYLVYSSLLTQ